MSGSSKEHIIKSYDDELSRLTGEIVRMGELSVSQLEAAIDVVERRDELAAQHVVLNDDAIDQLEQEISHDVVRLLALRAPIAGDLRNVFAALRIAADIERIGDHATNIAESVWFQVTGEPLTKQRSKRDFTSAPELPKLGDRPD